MTKPLAHDDKGVQSVDRVLDMIEVLAEEQKGLGVTELANRVGLHKSTAHRLLADVYKRQANACIQKYQNKKLAGRILIVSQLPS